MLLPFLPRLAAWLASAEPDPGTLVFATCIAFNGLHAIGMLPVVEPLARLLRRLFPEQSVAVDACKPGDLEPEALACDTRKALRIGDHVEDMFNRTIEVLATDDARPAREI